MAINELTTVVEQVDAQAEASVVDARASATVVDARAISYYPEIRAVDVSLDPTSAFRWFRGDSFEFTEAFSYAFGSYITDTATLLESAVVAHHGLSSVPNVNPLNSFVFNGG